MVIYVCGRKGFLKKHRVQIMFLFGKNKKSKYSTEPTQSAELNGFYNTDQRMSVVYVKRNHRLQNQLDMISANRRRTALSLY